MVPAWTLLVALAAGAVLGFLGSRLASRPARLEAAQGEPDPVTPQPVEAAKEPEPPAPEPVRIGMEDVVSELERRYQGRQAEGAEKRSGARRRRRA